MQINATGGLRDLAQSIVVELRFHHLALCVLDETAFAFSFNRDERALRRTDADRKDSHARIRGFLGFFRRISAKFLAVSENNKSAIPHCAFAKCLDAER